MSLFLNSGVTLDDFDNFWHAASQRNLT